MNMGMERWDFLLSVVSSPIVYFLKTTRAVCPNINPIMLCTHVCDVNYAACYSNRLNRRSLIGHHRMANLLRLISLLKNAAWTSKNSISTKASNFQIFLKKNGLPTKILKLGTTLSSNQPTKAVPWSFGALTFVNKKLLDN